MSSCIFVSMDLEASSLLLVIHSTLVTVPEGDRRGKLTDSRSLV